MIYCVVVHKNKFIHLQACKLDLYVRDHQQVEKLGFAHFLMNKLQPVDLRVAIHKVWGIDETVIEFLQGNIYICFRLSFILFQCRFHI